jgi:hypothetical protein
MVHRVVAAAPLGLSGRGIPTRPAGPRNFSPFTAPLTPLTSHTETIWKASFNHTMPWSGRSER